MHLPLRADQYSLALRRRWIVADCGLMMAMSAGSAQQAASTMGAVLETNGDISFIKQPSN
jgi:hypothetical protein